MSSGESPGSWTANRQRSLSIFGEFLFSLARQPETSELERGNKDSSGPVHSEKLLCGVVVAARQRPFRGERERKSLIVQTAVV